jgi:hypothetical protein
VQSGVTRSDSVKSVIVRKARLRLRIDHSTNNERSWSFLFSGNVFADNKFGEKRTNSLESHHNPAQRDGNRFYVQTVWPDDHAAVELRGRIAGTDPQSMIPR